jgi:hypothetical protein
MRQITIEEATRTEHLPDCAGYEDCECFSSRYNHSEIYAMQQQIDKLRREVNILRENLNLLM